MHRCTRAAGFVGFAACCVVYLSVALVVCVILVLPFLLLVALDALVGERAPQRALTVAPPAPPQQPVAMTLWSHRAA
jgi:hypothetical protein